MAVNHYFQQGLNVGRSSEQLLYEDLIIECLKIYGFDVYYLPRQTVFKDNILNEDALNNFNQAHLLEMYLSNVQGFEGEGDLLTKFGVELRDTANFIVSRRRWDQAVARRGNVQLSTRPAEGDLLFFPLTNSFFEIRRVETEDPFFQVGKLYVYTLQCELYQYSSEEINTGITDIDSVVDERSLNIQDYQLLMEDGNKFIYEYETPSYAILESFDIDSIDVLAQNDDFEAEIDVLDFTETNPFGEVYNNSCYKNFITQLLENLLLLLAICLITFTLID